MLLFTVGLNNLYKLCDMIFVSFVYEIMFEWVESSLLSKLQANSKSLIWYKIIFRSYILILMSLKLYCFIGMAAFKVTCVAENFPYSEPGYTNLIKTAHAIFKTIKNCYLKGKCAKHHTFPDRFIILLFNHWNQSSKLKENTSIFY